MYTKGAKPRANCQFFFRILIVKTHRTRVDPRQVSRLQVIFFKSYLFSHLRLYVGVLCLARRYLTNTGKWYIPTGRKILRRTRGREPERLSSPKIDRSHQSAAAQNSDRKKESSKKTIPSHCVRGDDQCGDSALPT